MTHDGVEEELRCPKCNKLLLRVDGDVGLFIRCRRCKWRGPLSSTGGPTAETMLGEKAEELGMDPPTPKDSAVIPKM